MCFHWHIVTSNVPFKTFPKKAQFTNLRGMSVAAATTSSSVKTPGRSRRRKPRTLPNAITKAIGAEIRRVRQARGMTQLALAMTGELERTRVSKVELGMVNPSVLSLASICHVLGITLADLFADIRLSHPPTTEGGGLRRANQAVLDKPAKRLRGAKGAASSVRRQRGTSD